MGTILARHFPPLKRFLNKKVNAFQPWRVQN
jgi:hypothetical protein